MAASRDLDKFLEAYREVADRVRRIELETKITRITLEDITTNLSVELKAAKPNKRGRATNRR